MSEINEHHSLLWPRAHPPRRLVDPVAFFVALIAAPLAVAVGTFWVFGIPVFAILFGAPFYLLLGTPLMAAYLRRSAARPGAFAILGLIANLGTPILLAAYAMLINDTQLRQMWLFFFGFGAIFAAAWCATFAVIYRRLERPFYAQPILKGAIA